MGASHQALARLALFERSFEVALDERILGLVVGPALATMVAGEPDAGHRAVDVDLRPERPAARGVEEAGHELVAPRFAAGLEDLGLYSHVWLLYWMDRARRDLIQQVPAHLGRPRGTFALRSPVRPNPIALAAVELLGIDGTPLLDIKPYFASTDSFPDARRP